MRRGGRLACTLTSFGLIVVVAALGSGIRVGTTLGVHSSKDDQANRIYNRSVRVCRHLYLTGIVERRTDGDAEPAACSFFGVD
jgi:hypothetical protein